MIMDFGISHMIISTTTVETATNANKGSLRWQARELLVDEHESGGVLHHTKQSDIWAFGMTCLVKFAFSWLSIHTLIEHDRRSSHRRYHMRVTMTFESGSSCMSEGSPKVRQILLTGRQSRRPCGTYVIGAGSGRAVIDLT